MRSDARAQFLLDVFVTALEGGLSYWSSCEKYYWQKEDGDDDIHGFFARIIDDETEKEYRIDADVIARGLNRISDGTANFGGQPLTHGPLVDRIKKANRENEAADLDASDADCIVQVGLFNDVVYG